MIRLDTVIIWLAGLFAFACAAHVLIGVTWVIAQSMGEAPFAIIAGVCISIHNEQVSSVPPRLPLARLR